MRLFLRIIGIALALGLVVGSGSAQTATTGQPDQPARQSQRLSDDEIRDIIIQQSIASYSGSCPCPYSRARNGSRCGGRSAYSRPGGASPKCYRSDISDAEVRRLREQIEPQQSRFRAEVDRIGLHDVLV